MSKIQRAWNVLLGKEADYTTQIYDTIKSIRSGSYVSSNPEAQSTIFTCSKILGETIGRLPLNLYNFTEDMGKIKDVLDYRYDILHNQPNSYLTSNQFFTTLEYQRNINGNSFARIHRNNGGRLLNLEILNPKKVKGYKVVEGELYYKIEDIEQPLHSTEILHFRLLSKDGIWGITPITALRLNLSVNNQALNKLNDYYANDLTTTKVLKAKMANVQTKDMNEAIDRIAESHKDGRIIPLPANVDLEELSLNFADAIFIDTMKYNSSMIAAAYNVPPHLVGLFESSKFNNVEQMGLFFKSTTISSIARMYRQELESKLLTSKERLTGKSIEFNSNAMIEYDFNTKTNALQKYFYMGVLSPAQIATMEGFVIDEEDMKKKYIQTNMTTLDNINNIQPSVPKNNTEEDGN